LATLAQAITESLILNSSHSRNSFARK